MGAAYLVVLAQVLDHLPVVRQRAGTLEGDVTPQPDVQINDLKFSTRIQDGLPSVISTNFSNPIRRMYVFFTYDKFDQGVQWTALWYRDGNLVCHESYPWDGGTGGYYYSECDVPVDGWQPGAYFVQIFVGHDFKRAGSFIVEGTASTLAPVPIPTAMLVPTPTP